MLVLYVWKNRSRLDCLICESSRPRVPAGSNRTKTSVGLSRLHDYFRSMAQVELPSGSDLWSDRARPNQSILWLDSSALETPCALKMCSKLSLIRPFQTEMTSDQTKIRLLSRRLCDHDPDQTEAIIQTIARTRSFLIRLFCAKSHFWSDYCALEITSDQNQLRSKYSDLVFTVNEFFFVF